MSVTQSPKKEINESQPGWQPYLLWFAIVVAVALILLPLLPGLISNLVYSFHSFEGKSPKIYWYLSRSAGFVALTLLWLSMALGLGITNKMARQWPGVAAAFALHEYVSLLGLAFSIYHGLVLLGDHFVDFSLPRLLTPFSIEHEMFWVGIGQVSFYIWCVAVFSFYIRQWIGQKAWRFVHYTNFATFIMALFHGIYSGTDSELTWVRGFYWAAGLSLLMLLVYRIYDSGLLNKISIPKFAIRHTQQQTVEATAKTPTQPSIATRSRNLPQALIQAQSRNSVARHKSENEPILESVIVPTNHEISVEASPAETIQQPVNDETIEQPLGSPTKDVPVPMDQGQVADVEVKEKSRPMVKLDETSQKKPRIRILSEPATKPIPQLQDSDEMEFSDELSLLIKLKNRFRGMLVEPITPKRQPQHERIGFSDD